jgi:hypothetical protein
MSKMPFEVPREMGWALVTENYCRFLHGTAIPQYFNRLPLALLKKPDVRACTHLFVKISFQRPRRHVALLCQQRDGPMRRTSQFRPILNVMHSAVHVSISYFLVRGDRLSDYLMFAGCCSFTYPGTTNGKQWFTSSSPCQSAPFFFNRTPFENPTCALYFVAGELELLY